jgi:23S rRNA (cytidine1920-2'-O)/16S rRNA (cytidine1409-2'-O)-methyltransferase
VVKRRIDVLLVEKGLAESRTRAQSLIMAGEVKVDGQPVNRPASLVTTEAEITVDKPPPFVSRGGIKLEHALSYFQINTTSKVAADIGASTGGFTDCLLQRGASRVYAIDVGYGQLDYNLRRDPRVVVMERVNARYPFELPEKVDLVTIDLSFISVEKVIPSARIVINPDGDMVVLIKPQFEARREEVGKGGVIKLAEIHARVLGRFIRWAVGNELRLRGLTASPILGASGNREFLVWLRLT